MELRKTAPLASSRVTATAHELEVPRAVEEDDDAGNGHSLRWTQFVTCKLQTLGGKKPDGLPGVGAVYAKKWIARGQKTALAVFAVFLRHGAKRFAEIAEKEIGMRSNAAQDLVSALESRWSSLTLVGSAKSDLKRNAEPVGDHSARWGIFVNCKLSETELADLPGVGPKTLPVIAKQGISTTTQMLGEYVFRGRQGFEAFSEEAFGMRKIGNNDNPGELSSALEAKWNALTLSGSD